MITVLYVDDEADTEAMQSRFEVMADEGVRVVPATHVDEAIRVLKERFHEFGAVVLDIIMPPPEMFSLAETQGGTATGMVALRYIRKLYPKLPVIVVSVRAEQEAKNMVTEFSDVAYVPKPVEADFLAREIKRVTSGRGRTDTGKPA